MGAIYNRGRHGSTSPTIDRLKRKEANKIYVDKEEFDTKLPIVDSNIETNNGQIEKYGFNPTGDDKIKELRFWDSFGNLVRRNSLDSEREIVDTMKLNESMHLPGKTPLYQREAGKIFGNKTLEVFKEDVSAWEPNTDIYTPNYKEGEMPVNIVGLDVNSTNPKLTPGSHYKLPTNGLRKPIGFIKRTVNDFIGLYSDMTVVMISGTTGDVVYYPLLEDNNSYQPYMSDADIEVGMVPEMFGTQLTGIIPIDFIYNSSLDLLVINTTNGLFKFDCSTKAYNYFEILDGATPIKNIIKVIPIEGSNEVFMIASDTISKIYTSASSNLYFIKLNLDTDAMSLKTVTQSLIDGSSGFTLGTIDRLNQALDMKNGRIFIYYDHTIPQDFTNSELISNQITFLDLDYTTLNSIPTTIALDGIIGFNSQNNMTVLDIIYIDPTHAGVVFYNINEAGTTNDVENFLNKMIVRYDINTGVSNFYKENMNVYNLSPYAGDTIQSNHYLNKSAQLMGYSIYFRFSKGKLFFSEFDSNGVIKASNMIDFKVIRNQEILRINVTVEYIIVIFLDGTFEYIDSATFMFDYLNKPIQIMNYDKNQLIFHYGLNDIYAFGFYGYFKWDMNSTDLNDVSYRAYKEDLSFNLVENYSNAGISGTPQFLPNNMIIHTWDNTGITMLDVMIHQTGFSAEAINDDYSSITVMTLTDDDDGGFTGDRITNLGLRCYHKTTALATLNHFTVPIPMYGFSRYNYSFDSVNDRFLIAGVFKHTDTGSTEYDQTFLMGIDRLTGHINIYIIDIPTYDTFQISPISVNGNIVFGIKDVLYYIPFANLTKDAGNTEIIYTTVAELEALASQYQTIPQSTAFTLNRSFDNGIANTVFPDGDKLRFLLNRGHSTEMTYTISTNTFTIDKSQPYYLPGDKLNISESRYGINGGHILSVNTYGLTIIDSISLKPLYNHPMDLEGSNPNVSIVNGSSGLNMVISLNSKYYDNPSINQYGYQYLINPNNIVGAIENPKIVQPNSYFKSLGDDLTVISENDYGEGFISLYNMDTKKYRRDVTGLQWYNDSFTSLTTNNYDSLKRVFPINTTDKRTTKVIESVKIGNYVYVFYTVMIKNVENGRASHMMSKINVTTFDVEKVLLLNDSNVTVNGSTGFRDKTLDMSIYIDGTTLEVYYVEDYNINPIIEKLAIDTTDNDSIIKTIILDTPVSESFHIENKDIIALRLNETNEYAVMMSNSSTEFDSESGLPYLNLYVINLADLSIVQHKLDRSDKDLLKTLAGGYMKHGITISPNITDNQFLIYLAGYRTNISEYTDDEAKVYMKTIYVDTLNSAIQLVDTEVAPNFHTDLADTYSNDDIKYFNPKILSNNKVGMSYGVTSHRKDSYFDVVNELSYNNLIYDFITDKIIFSLTPKGFVRFSPDDIQADHDSTLFTKVDLNGSIIINGFQGYTRSIGSDYISLLGNNIAHPTHLILDYQVDKFDSLYNRSTTEMQITDKEMKNYPDGSLINLKYTNSDLNSANVFAIYHSMFVMANGDVLVNIGSDHDRNTMLDYNGVELTWCNHKLLNGYILTYNSDIDKPSDVYDYTKNNITLTDFDNTNDSVDDIMKFERFKHQLYIYHSTARYIDSSSVVEIINMVDHTSLSHYISGSNICPLFNDGDEIHYIAYKPDEVYYGIYNFKTGEETTKEVDFPIAEIVNITTYMYFENTIYLATDELNIYSYDVAFDQLHEVKSLASDSLAGYTITKIDSIRNAKERIFLTLRGYKTGDSSLKERFIPMVEYFPETGALDFTFNHPVGISYSKMNVPGFGPGSSVDLEANRITYIASSNYIEPETVASPDVCLIEREIFPTNIIKDSTATVLKSSTPGDIEHEIFQGRDGENIYVFGTDYIVYTTDINTPLATGIVTEIPKDMIIDHGVLVIVYNSGVIHILEDYRNSADYHTANVDSGFTEFYMTHTLKFGYIQDKQIYKFTDIFTSDDVTLVETTNLEYYVINIYNGEISFVDNLNQFCVYNAHEEKLEVKKLFHDNILNIDLDDDYIITIFTDKKEYMILTDDIWIETKMDYPNGINTSKVEKFSYRYKSYKVIKNKHLIIDTSNNLHEYNGVTDVWDLVGALTFDAGAFPIFGTNDHDHLIYYSDYSKKYYSYIDNIVGGHQGIIESNDMLAWITSPLQTHVDITGGIVTINDIFQHQTTGDFYISYTETTIDPLYYGHILIVDETNTLLHDIETVDALAIETSDGFTEVNDNVYVKINDTNLAVSTDGYVFHYEIFDILE